MGKMTKDERFHDTEKVDKFCQNLTTKEDILSQFARIQITSGELKRIPDETARYIHLRRQEMNLDQATVDRTLVLTYGAGAVSSARSLVLALRTR